MIYAIDCGDDTDCTGATVGAFLGILYGVRGIPADWSEYIGDKIVTVAMNNSEHKAPKTCKELTERIMRLIPVVMKAHRIDAELSDRATDLSDELDNRAARRALDDLMFYKPYSYFACDAVYAQMYVWYDQLPQIKAGEPVTAHITIRNKFPNPGNFYVRLYLPEGFFASDYPKLIHAAHGNVAEADAPALSACAEWRVTITAEGNIAPVNRVVAEITSPGKSLAAYVPILLLG